MARLWVMASTLARTHSLLRTLNTSIAKLDYQPTDRHHLFIRSNLQKDAQSGVLQYPGQPASNFTIDNNNGVAAGWDWTSPLISSAIFVMAT
jgi:hypothetical protein